MSTDLAKENPYVAVATKKHRNLKKKLEKIAKIEQQLSSGKALDQEQLILLSSKKSVEKAFADVATLKAQLEEVAKAELDQQQGKAPPAEEEEVVENRGDEEKPEAFESNEVAVEELVEVANETANVETNTELEFQERVVQYAVSTMTEPDAEVAKTNEAKRRLELEDKVTKLLKALHVYQRYKEVTTRNLPDNVDFFGRTLLGLTTISGFQDTLHHSARFAGYYLNDDLAIQNEVVRGCNYLQMSHVIDNLSDEMERIPPNRGGTGTLTALLRNTISTPAMHPSEPTVNARPVPHIPPATDIPGVSDVPPSKFELATPQPVPQFVQLDIPLDPPNFGTLQFGAVSSSVVAPSIVSSVPTTSSPLYATINFQPEPFFQLAPPSISSSVIAPSHTVVSQVEREPIVETAQINELAVEVADITLHTTDSTDTAADDLNNQGENNKSEGEDGPSDPADPASAGKRKHRNRRRNNKEGGENSNNNNHNNLEGVDKQGKRKNDRFRDRAGKKEGEGNEEAAGTAEGNKGGFQKKKPFNRDNGKGENTQSGADGKDSKDYNWTKKANKHSENKDRPRKEAVHEHAETSEPATPAPVASQPIVQADPSPQPVAPEAASKPSEPIEAPKADAVKRSSYQDAVRAGLAAAEPKGEDTKPSQPQKKPFKDFHHTAKKSGDDGDHAAKDNNRPRRDRSNNHVPREGGAVAGAGGGEHNREHKDRERGGDRPPSNRYGNDRQGGPDGDNNGERRPFYRNNNNHANKQAGSSNNTNNNNNNSRTVNNSQSVRRPAPSTKTESV